VKNLSTIRPEMCGSHPVTFMISNDEIMVTREEMY
jgi:hypothetical protein